MQGEDIVPIRGTKRRKSFGENSRALDVEITADELRRIDDVISRGSVAGSRYPEEMMKGTLR